MKHIKVILLLLSLTFGTSNLLCNELIALLCTAALIPQGYGERKQQYIDSLIKLKSYGCDPYLVESVAKGPTFLDSYCNHVCYTHSNDAACGNKGVNEARSMLIGLKYFNFSPGTMIIKFTGRYLLETDEFLHLVANNADADAIVRIWDGWDAYTALFAIKLEYLLDFLENYINYKEMQEKHICIEHLFASYINQIEKNGAKIVYLPKVYDYLPIVRPHDNNNH